MRKAICLVAALAAELRGSYTSADEPLLAGEYLTPSEGQPICVKPEDLTEYLMAGFKQDSQWIQQIKGCGMLKGGLKVVVLEDFPSDSELAHVVKIRAFGTTGSAIGYTISLGLQPK